MRTLINSQFQSLDVISNWKLLVKASILNFDYFSCSCGISWHDSRSLKSRRRTTKKKSYFVTFINPKRINKERRKRMRINSLFSRGGGAGGGDHKCQQSGSEKGSTHSIRHCWKIQFLGLMTNFIFPIFRRAQKRQHKRVAEVGCASLSLSLTL